MAIFLTVISVLLLCQFFFTIWNMKQFPVLKPASFSSDEPMSLSILIPARNEEKRIEACLQSIVDQRHHPKELIVLDDHSTDQTRAMVERFAETYPWIRVQSGRALKQGWLGKSYACSQLAEVAASNWLLFLDADVRLKRGAIEAIYNQLCTQKTGMLSGFPEQKTGTLFEQLVVPMMMFTIGCHLPVKWVGKSKNPAFAAAHGGFIAIEKTCYYDIGGHEAIKDSLVDDMALARRVKEIGFPFTLSSIHPFVYMRMYESGQEVWEGYRKNVFPGVNRNIALLSSVFCVYTMLYLAPVICFMVALLQLDMLSICLATLCYGLGVSIKATIDIENGRTSAMAFLLPVSILSLIAIGFASMKIGLKKEGYEWKGRRYE
ncbi:glycosyltransferase family 2 protein [Bacillus pumilus]|uniref:glycosyltransferase n=1 Tax=Bacillus pumilus TaxID=1408 RepID=UPI0011E957F7|nr:glycosyltransferase [Bacillus pumilus]TYS29713.1 glycosyltransferase [Bacillus pumilus]TYS41595.1 glycosyltransferase [Bacillus pumilus]